ncbi:hypothetical protein [Mycobacterium sp. 050134]|uniref:hypothetical protein n=1 Tax=Mycobacterium sp. 050134 TaxID=3096111 RepID=UPI002EDA9D3A
MHNDASLAPSKSDLAGAAAASKRESLLDTFPGRLFIVRILEFGCGSDYRSPQEIIDSLTPDDLIRAAASAVRDYLYSDECLNVTNLDAYDPELQAADTAALAALAKLSTFASPQIHQGTLTQLRPPQICNRKHFCALPGDAFWTSTPMTDNEDSWLISGENLRHASPRWEVHFDTTKARVARVNSARDWIDLITSNSVTAGGCLYPDWPALARFWDAVHLSPAGLVLAHPTISTTPFFTTDGSGLAHSEAGPYASVAIWSVVSTAWLNTPPGVELKALNSAE